MFEIICKTVWKNWDGLTLGVLLPVLFAVSVFCAIGVEAYSIFFAVCMAGVCAFPLCILIADVRWELEKKR